MRIKLVFSYMLLGLALIQYQNCAPTNESLEQEAGSPVDVIDHISVGAISFPQTKVSAFMDQSVVVDGVCDQSGALISWKLFDSSGQLVERGLAECDLGSFSVQLSSQWQNYCDDTLQLEAALGVDASSTTQVEANCQ